MLTVGGITVVAAIAAVIWPSCRIASLREERSVKIIMIRTPIENDYKSPGFQPGTFENPVETNQA